MRTLTSNTILFAEMQSGNTFFIKPQLKSRLHSFALPYNIVHSVCFGYMHGANKSRNKSMQTRSATLI